MTSRERAFVRFYLGSWKVPIVLSTILRGADIVLKGVVTGLWLGLLTPRLMSCLDEWYYTKGFPQYLDEGYNRSGWFDWEKPVIEEYFARLPNVLVAAGAGAGREVLALRRMGIRAMGYEYNPALVELGNRILREEGFEEALAVAPDGEVGAGEERFAGVIVGWATYTLIPGRAARIALLRQARARTVEGAPLLVSIFDRAGDRGFFRVSTAAANLVRRVMRRPLVEEGDTLSVSYAHRFTEAELAVEMREGGFRMVKFQRGASPFAVGVAE
jgi:hypothetical protein